MAAAQLGKCFKIPGLNRLHSILLVITLQFYKMATWYATSVVVFF